MNKPALEVVLTPLQVAETLHREGVIGDRELLAICAATEPQARMAHDAD